MTDFLRRSSPPTTFPALAPRGTSIFERVSVAMRCLSTSITAVGALHAYKTELQVASKDESLLKRALIAYQEAVTALRKNLSLASGDVDLCSTISATFLLGLFEVGLPNAMIRM